MTDTALRSGEGLPWEDGFDDNVPDLPDLSDLDIPIDGGGGSCSFTDETVRISAVSRLLDQMVTDIQHLEVEIVRTRYRLSFYLKPPYDEYMRMELFSGMGGRYQGNTVFDSYLRYRGFDEYEDAIDTPFHVARMLRLADGHDDYPDLYP